jgi:hypothetical protein
MYSAPKFAFGLSATHLTHRLPAYKDDWFRFPLHVYTFLEFGLGNVEKTIFKPRIQVMSAMSSADTVSFMDRMDIMLDVGGTFFIRVKFWIGGSFRTDFAFDASSAAAMVGINLTPNIRVGYSYDYKLGNTFQNVRNFGTHEIMLNYRMKIREEEVAEATPRFFE